VERSRRNGPCVHHCRDASNLWLDAKQRSKRWSTSLEPERQNLVKCWSRLLLLAKHLFEQGGCLRCGIGADLLFLLPQFVEQTIEGLAHHVAIEVEALASQQWAGHGILGYRVELLDDAYVLHRLVHDGSERLGQLRGTGLLEVVRGRGVAA